MSTLLPTAGHWLFEHFWKVAWAILGIALPLYAVDGADVDLWAAGAYAAMTTVTWAIGRKRARVGVAVHLVALFLFWTWYVMLPGGIPHRIGPSVPLHMILLVPTAISLVALWGVRGIAATVVTGGLCVWWAWDSLTDQTFAAYLLGVALLVGLMFRRLVTHLEDAQARVRRAVERQRLLQTITVAANQAQELDEALAFAVEALCRHEDCAVGHALVATGDEPRRFLSAGIWYEKRKGAYQALRDVLTTEERPAGDVPWPNAPGGGALVDVDLSATQPSRRRIDEAKRAGLRRCLVLSVAVDDAIVAVVELYGDHSLAPEDGMADVFRQVSNQLGVVEHRTRAASAVLRNARDYQQLFEQAHDAIVIFDPDDEVVLEVNRRACDIYAFSRDELIGMPLSRIVVDDTASQTKMQQLVEQGGSMQFEAVHRTSDGEQLHLEVNASRFEYRGKNAILSLNRDVSQRKRLERQFLQAQRMDAMGRLAAGVAHDFNNMMTAVLGYAELLEMELTDDDVRADLREIQRAAEKSSALAQQLLAFSSSQPSKPAIVSLNELVLDMQKLLRRVLRADIELSLDLSDDLHDIEADPNHLEQVLMNLVVNARDAMPRGGRLVVRTENVVGPLQSAAPGRATPAANQRAGALLTVADSGSGMNERTRSRVFEPFFTTKAPGAGTGLGLATVYGVVTQNQGQVEVESELGKGSQFKVYFPRALQARDADAATESAKQLTAGAETILVVEDEPAVRELACRALQEAGYQVLKAKNGADAVGHLMQGAPSVDLVVTDVVMPKMGGTELAAEISRSETPPPILFISGYVDDDQVRQLVRDGATHFLEKPFTPQILTERVREVLDGARR
ncbi:MAG: response regulator [Deltaproteobacteria bacterium]|jgi:PAS domain S-box-containing protein|nr:response regulator [Deltaproteobacteria bacterium]MBW2532961.1 response regulator [Deltaproteobacteria bacterium]